MNRTRLTITGTLCLSAILISSCSLLGIGLPEDVKASLAAGALLDYVAADGLAQVQELDMVGDTYDLTAGGGPDPNARSVSEDVTVREYANVTVTITRETDDQDSATPTDDIMTVTRELDYGFEANAIHILVRPLRPTTSPDWDSYTDDNGANGWLVDPDGKILQSGTVESLLGDVALSGGTVEATWARIGADIFAEQVVRELHNVVHPEVVHRTIIVQTLDGTTSLIREREVNGTVVHWFTVEPYTDPDTGATLVRINRDDGSYAIVRARGTRFGEPRIVDYYNADDQLVMHVEEVRSAPAGTMTSTRTHYGPDGEVTGTRVVTYAINYMEGEEDRVQITRTVDGRQRTLTITESGDVYFVTIGGEIYRMRVSGPTSVEFLDDGGNVVMTASQLADGSWQITAGGETTIV